MLNRNLIIKLTILFTISLTALFGMLTVFADMTANKMAHENGFDVPADSMSYLPAEYDHQFQKNANSGNSFATFSNSRSYSGRSYLQLYWVECVVNLV